jgi:hypothetical protein
MYVFVVTMTRIYTRTRQVQKLVDEKTEGPNSFLWQQQLRFYWTPPPPSSSYSSSSNALVPGGAASAAMTTPGTIM